MYAKAWLMCEHMIVKYSYNRKTTTAMTVPASVTVDKHPKQPKEAENTNNNNEHTIEQTRKAKLLYMYNCN